MERSEKATRHVLSDSLKELLRKRSIDKISTAEICEAAGVSRRNFYRHFQDKYALLSYIYYRDFVIDSVHYEGWTIWDYFPHITAHLYSDRAFYANAFEYTGQNSFREYCYDLLYLILHRDFADSFDSPETEEFMLRHVCYMVFDSFVKWLRSDPCMPPDEYARITQGKIARFSETFDEVIHRDPVNTKGDNVVHAALIDIERVSPAKEERE